MLKRHGAEFLLVLAVVVIVTVWTLWRSHPTVREDQATFSTEAGPASSSADRDEEPSKSSLVSLIPTDLPDSQDPVERAVAMGEVLDTQFENTLFVNQWRRIRLVRSPVQPRLVRVSELWNFDPGGGKPICLAREMFLADQVILKTVPGVDEAELGSRLDLGGMSLLEPLGVGAYTARLKETDLMAVPRALRFLSGLSGLVEMAEADGVGFGAGTPNDSRFAEQWGLHNTGQSGGTVNADFDGPEFWDIIEGAPGILIALLDSGLNFTHPDLQNIAWTNPGETAGDGIDNDTSGKIDDIQGWDFVD